MTNKKKLDLLANPFTKVADFKQWVLALNDLQGVQINVVVFGAGAQWLILVLGQYVENFKPLNFRSGTFYNKVYEMKYLQNTNMYFFHFNILLFWCM